MKQPLLRRILCRLGFHKWNVIPGSIRRPEKHTETAALICEHCAKMRVGERWV